MITVKKHRNHQIKMGLILCAHCELASAGGGAATDAYNGINQTADVDTHAFADVYLLHNFNNPTSGKNQLREFDLFSDNFSLNYLRLTLARHPRRLGFRLDIGAGNTASVYFQQDPAATTHPELAHFLSYFGQAFVTMMVPLNREIEIEVDLGRFSTPVGFEDNESVSNWNYSRSLIYSWAEPSLHTGVRLSSQLTKAFAASLFWVNGWNSTFADGNEMRTVAGAVSWKPAEQIDLVLVYMAGLEHPPTRLWAPLSFRNVLNANATYTPIKSVSFAISMDYGNDHTPGSASWWGMAGYARVQVKQWLTAAVRVECLADPEGFITGSRQSLAEATATIEMQKELHAVRLLVRLEFRRDQASARVFESTAPSTRSHQDTLTLALLTTF